MSKFFAFGFTVSAAFFLASNAFAECPKVQTTEEIVKHFEAALDVRCGVVNPKEPNFFFCGKNPILAISPTGELIDGKTIIPGDLTTVHHGTLEIVEAKDLYKDSSCKGMAALPFSIID